MTPSDLQARLRGALPFLVTPFDDALVLDLARLNQLVEFTAGYGFEALVVTGGVGELAQLDPDEQARVWEVAVAASRGRVPVLAGLGALLPAQGDLAEALLAVKRAEQAGIDGLLLFPPASVTANPEPLAAYVAAVTDATSMGLVLDHGAVPTSSAATAQAAGLPGVVGVKYSGADLAEWDALRLACRDLRHLAWLSGAGDDSAPEYFARNATAFSSSMANLCPELVQQLSGCLAAQDVRGARALARRMVPLATLRARGPGFSTAVLKAAMALVGDSAGGVRDRRVVVDRETLDGLPGAVAHLTAG